MQNPFGNFSAMHDAGVAFGTTIVMYGAGYSIGKNIIRVLRGKLRAPVAVAHVIRDAAIFFGVGYLGGLVSGGAINMAQQATTAANVPINMGAAPLPAGDDTVSKSAAEVSWAAGDLVNRVTNGLFGMMGSAGTSIGSKLTQATSDTAIGGAVATVVGTFSAAGSLFGGGVAAALPAILFGAIIGVIVTLIFDK